MIKHVATFIFYILLQSSYTCMKYLYLKNIDIPTQFFKLYNFIYLI